MRIGHVHLRVGNIEKAEKFYRGALGLDLTRRRGGATFMSSGGYHHHVGANVWHSDGAGKRDDDRAGLAWFSVEAADGAAYDAAIARLKTANAPVNAAASGIETADPFGTRVRLLKPLSRRGARTDRTGAAVARRRESIAGLHHAITARELGFVERHVGALEQRIDAVARPPFADAEAAGQR